MAGTEYKVDNTQLMPITSAV